jgi:hypothetical protein
MKCGHRIVTVLINKQYKHEDDPDGMCDEGWSWKKAPWTSIRTECITNVSPVQLFYSRVTWHRGCNCCPRAVTSILKVKIFSMTFIGPGAKRKLLCGYVVCLSVRPSMRFLYAISPKMFAVFPLNIVLINRYTTQEHWKLQS